MIEDNNLSILTEKKVRRSWEMHNVGKGFGIESYNISDNPFEIKKFIKKPLEKPLLLNINTERKYGMQEQELTERRLIGMKMKLKK